MKGRITCLNCGNDTFELDFDGIEVLCTCSKCYAPFLISAQDRVFLIYP